MGRRLPGWHIECSAISRKLLGQPFDIHCGGVDHIGTHHANEIAQSEAAFGMPLANFWMHGEFLQINAGKMAKSEGTFITLDTLKEKGFSPLDFRYLCLTAHYRTQLSFTWESLQASHQALSKLYSFVSSDNVGHVGCVEYEGRFLEFIDKDLDIPKAMALVWGLIDDKDFTDSAKINTLLKFDEIFGLKLKEHPLHSTEFTWPDKIVELKLARDKARKNKDFKKSDELRKQIEELGYEVKDTPEGQKIRRKISI